ncbi:RecQ family ATP-dependent DNA helicase [Deinococcus wulumuqiensis]|nr:RecQ family ATP-dependent DNA helicase [Deinococcus wulumuqiensis]
MSPLLRRVLDYLRMHGPQTEEDLLEHFDLKRSLLTRLLKASRSQLRQQGEYLFIPGQEERVAELHGVPKEHITSYIIIDTETTSVDRAEARLLEVAALRIENGKLAGQLQLLVAGARVPRNVAELTGIQQDELDREGQPLAQVLQQLSQFIGQLPLVGHNAQAFDVPLLRRLYREQGLPFHVPFVLDTMLLAPLAFAGEQPPVESFSLEGLHARFCGEVHDDAHRALADCAATARLLDVMIARLQNRPDDQRQLLSVLPVPELALAFSPAPITRKDLESLSSQVAAAATDVSAVWSHGREPRTISDMLPTPRPGQMDMADAVAKTLRGPGRVVVEAPTGTGKTRAYLYPALLHGRPGRPVVISTHTKQLQDQIVSEARDLKDQGFKIQVVALKGQSNYICPERLQLLLTRRHRPVQPVEEKDESPSSSAEQEPPVAPEESTQPTAELPEELRLGHLIMSPGQARAAALLALHVQSGEYGAVPPSALTRSPEYQQVKIITSTVAKRCRPACPFSTACSYHRTQALVKQAQVVVVNHALLLRNQLDGLEQEELPFGRVIIDEAHDLQDAALAALRLEIGSDAVLSVAREFFRRTQGEPAGLLASIERAARQAKDLQLATYSQKASTAFDLLVGRVDAWQAALRAFALQFGQGSEAFGFQAAIDSLPMQSAEWRAVVHASEDLINSLKYCAGFIPSLAEHSAYRMDLEELQARLNKQIETLGTLLKRGLPGAYVYAAQAHEDSASLWAVPLWLSSRLEELWKKTDSLVFTSATLRVPGTWPAKNGSGEPEDFGVFERDLAIPTAEYMVLPPVLPYDKGHVVLTNHLPLVHHPDFPNMVGQEINNLVSQTPNQALHIFTANERLRRASRQIKQPHLNAVRDGTQRTVQELRQGEESHALGSAGFLQGVDIADLTLVSLDKTPFPIPDLILEAQRRDVKDFETYWNTLYLPRAVLKFVQGFGRLVRNDRQNLPPGAFVVWDKRLAFAHYQDRFLGALPIPPQNVKRARNRQDFYDQLSLLWNRPLIFGELVAPKLQAIHRYREELVGLQEPARKRKLEDALVELFEFPPGGFREGQYEGIVAALEGIDVLSVMPTGAGKSLVFQLPAFLGESYTVVISPLVALIQDQVSRLQQLGLPAAGLWSGLSRAEQDSTLEDVRTGKVKLLYLAPERIRKGAAVRKLLQQQPPERVVFDEAHTLLEWGHDFRPDYLHVRQELADLGVKGAVSAFTATATPEMRRKLIQVLGMDGPERTQLGVKRKNLYYEVVDVTAKKGRPRKAPEDEKVKKVSRDEVLLTMLAGLKTNPDTRDGRTIVYVGSRAKAERLAAMIGEIGIEVAAYHAGLSPAVRTELLDQFQARLIRVMVATNAFGMGVDAPDIHLVVHYDAPLSLESYVQEAGRAGRDPNIQARAVLLWSSGSERRAKYLIDHSYPDKAQAQRLLDLIKNGHSFPTLSELGACEGVDLNTLPTLLHLLEVSGAIRYRYVPGLCRVYPYYGVDLPDDPVVQDLVQRTKVEPVHLSRLYRKSAAAIEDHLIELQREGRLGVMLLEPALDIELRQDRIEYTGYEERVQTLKRAKHERFRELTKVLLNRQVCRSAQLQYHFEHRGEKCGNCDVCAPHKPAPWDGNELDFDSLWNPRKELLRLLAHLEKHEHFVGKGTLVRILRNEEVKAFQNAQEGVSAPKPFHWKEREAPNFGKLRFIRPQDIRSDLDKLCEEGLTQVEQRIFRAGGQPLPVVVLTDQGRKAAKAWGGS